MLLSAICVLVLLLAMSDSAPGRAVRQAFLSPRIPRITLGHVALLLIVVGVVAAVMMWAKSDALALIGPALPEALAWFAALDLAAYLDVMALMALLAATVRFRAVRATIRRALVQGRQLLRLTRVRAGRHVRRRSRRPSRKADDEPGWVGPPAFI